MSSSTSSSSQHRRFAIGLLALVLVPVSVLFGVGLYLEPLEGDLTRTGSFAENDFGWNTRQLEFKRPLHEVGHYDRYYDVVVLGDSFSLSRPGWTWQNYLAAATDWSITTLDIGQVTLAQILANPIFRTTPPRVLILETVEREVPGHMNVAECDTTPLPIPVSTQPLRPSSVTWRASDLQPLTTVVQRDRSRQDIKLGYVRNYLWRSFLRTLPLKRQPGRAVKVQLADDAPFSSATKDALLVYRNDLRKGQGWRGMDLSQMACRIETMRRQVEKNGQTRFVFMVAPDKLTAYARYVRDDDLRNLSLLAELSDRLPHAMPRLDTALTSAIGSGEQDVYLPNDTHWGSSGYRIATETLLGFLQAPQHTKRVEFTNVPAK